MENQELQSILLCGIVLMCVLIAVQMKWYDIRRWKCIIVSSTLVLTGVIGSYIWYFVENGYFGGRSFYGAIVFSPLVFYPVSKLLKIPYRLTMDFVAPAGCMTLAMVKFQCLRDHCCLGKVLYIDENHFYVRFPSQIVEMIAFLSISVALMVISRKEEHRGSIFQWFLVLYGASRFVLDFFRDVSQPYALGLSAGSFWSMCAFIVGAVLLCQKRFNRQTKSLT